jgi:hypothetical protein
MFNVLTAVQGSTFKVQGFSGKSSFNCSGVPIVEKKYLTAGPLSAQR